MTWVENGVYLVALPGMSMQVPLVFYDLPDGSQYLHFGARATPKRT